MNHKTQNAKSKLIFIVFLISLITACATQYPSQGDVDSPGFLFGLLHGFLILFTLIGSFFTDYEIYAIPNSGWPYNLGYVIGAGMFLGGGGSTTR